MDLQATARGFRRVPLSAFASRVRKAWLRWPKRSRKLLAHKREIEKLRGRLTTRGYTLVPLQVYFKNGVAKIQLGLGKGKKLHDDRESIRRKQDLREARDAMRRR